MVASNDLHLLSLVSSTSPFLLVTTSLVALISYYIISARVVSSLRSIPGPYLASLTKLWLVYVTMKKERHSLDIELHKKYGPVVRMAPDVVSVAIPSDVKVIYSKSPQRLDLPILDAAKENLGAD